MWSYTTQQFLILWKYVNTELILLRTYVFAKSLQKSSSKGKQDSSIQYQSKPNSYFLYWILWEHDYLHSFFTAFPDVNHICYNLFALDENTQI